MTRIVVTGAAGPLGRQICHRLAESGHKIVATDVNAEQCDELVQSLSGVGHSALQADLSSQDGLESLLAALRQYDDCSGLVNNAAFTGSSGMPGYAVPLPEQTVDAFSAALWLNTTVPFALVQGLSNQLRKHSGRVVNISSIYGLVGPNMNLYEGTQMGNPAAYAASKGAVAQLTRYFSTVLAPEILVNCVAPGGIFRGQPDAFVERYSALTPLGRMATEDDFGGIIDWLISSDNQYVTGQTIAVDGGWTAW